MTLATQSQPATALGSESGKRRFKNNLATVLITLSVLIALVPLVWVLWTVISKGLSTIVSGSWWTSTMKGVTYIDPGGGALAAIVGTLEQVGLCTLISVPIALLVAVYLVEYGYGKRFARVTTFTVDILTGIPSIVAALFIFTLVVQATHASSGYLVSLALVILMVPVIVRTSEEMLRLVPNELREASFALGIPKWRTIMRVVIPTAFTGIVTGVVLGVARVAGETAPLLILSGYSDSMNWNLFTGGFQGALPTLIYDQFRNAGQVASGGGYHLDANGNRVAGSAVNYSVDRMWGAALTLILIVLLLNVIARLIGRFNKVAR
jgi:phosphate transport system permease protein